MPVSGQLMIDNGEALLTAARNGLGLILQPLELLAEDIASGRLVEVLPDFPLPVRQFHLIYAKDRRMTPKLSAFIAFAIETFGPNAVTKPSPSAD
ncbi:hypothetical protein LIN78_13420 [Leeia sp. TBRC 13508]|uniref:LysR substrate-binding domain-containing protein n=1 Tax=Leeia speluncae TaxID=2884804 RepID=A0ABS8D943_9NEIS|nr:LysR substrate-binding domain-containing protein [Leeia speluncae]MCB6184543.1 hypothetical protein [Leeia speluncae]